MQLVNTPVVFAFGDAQPLHTPTRNASDATRGASLGSRTRRTVIQSPHCTPRELEHVMQILVAVPTE